MIFWVIAIAIVASFYWYYTRKEKVQITITPPEKNIYVSDPVPRQIDNSGLYQSGIDT